jgi:hypothetical protein
MSGLCIVAPARLVLVVQPEWYGRAPGAGLSTTFRVAVSGMARQYDL